MEKTFSLEVQRLIKAFGLQDSYPAVFDDKYRDTFDQFVNVIKLPFSEAVNRVYSAILFVKEMRRHRASPFKPSGVPLALHKVIPDSLIINLLRLRLNDEAAPLIKSVLGTHVAQFFGAVRSKLNIELHGATYKITATYVLQPKRKGDHIDALLPRLSGYLYHSREVPALLQQRYQRLSSKAKPKSTLPTAKALLADTKTNGWLYIDAGLNFRLFATRSKEDNLIVRYSIDIPNILSFRRKSDMRTLLTKLWRAIPIL